MVNAAAPCEDVATVRRMGLGAVLAVTLVGCAGGSERDLVRYYDPRGLFVTSLPAANTLAVSAPQLAEDGSGLLTGVTSTPPQPSAAPQAGLTSFGNLGTGDPGDQTVYQALAVVTESFVDLEEMALFYVTGDPAIDVIEVEPVRIDGLEGTLLITDVTQQGAVTASLAVALTLGRDGTGFIVVAVFPPDTWGGERGDFFRVLESFRTEVPAGLASFPMAGRGA